MNKLKKYIPFALIFLLTIVLFRPYVFQHKVPFPSNLLVSFYQPWASYPNPAYPNGVPNKPMGFDDLRIYYPLRKLTTDQLKNFIWPLWNPYDFAGNTQLATYQSAVFHPFSFLFFILPMSDAWSIIILLQPLLAGWFTYLFLQSLNLSKKSSFFGAILFGFSGFIIVNMEESFMATSSALFLPLILYGITRIFKKFSVWDFVIITVGLLCSLLSGWFQMTLYTWGFAFVYLLFIFFQTKQRKLSILFLVLSTYIFALTISAIHLIPGIEGFLYSARGTSDVKFIFDTYLMPWYYLVTYIAPDVFGNPGSYNYFGQGFFYEKILFIGLPAFILGLYQLFQFRKNNSVEKFFLFAWLITLSLGFSLPTSWGLLYYLKLPFISTILPTRIFFLSTFSLSIVATYGLERYLSSKRNISIKIIVVIIGISIIGAALYYIPQMKHLKTVINSTVAVKNLVLPAIFLFIFITIDLLRRFFSKKVTYTLIIILSLVGSLYFAQKYLYFSESQFIFPEVPAITQLKKLTGIDRFWSIGDGYINSNFSTYYKIPSFEGYDSIYIQRYGELLYAAQKDGKFESQVPRADASLPNVRNLSELIAHPFSLRLLSLVDAKYIVIKKDPKYISENTNPDLFPKVWEDDKFIIVENKNVTPRVFLTDQFVVKKTNQGILDVLFGKNTQLDKTVVLEKEPKNLQKNDTSLKSSIQILSYQPNSVSIKTQNNKDALLLLSDNYFPGWKATVDGKITEIYRADYSFRAIIVPSGNHTIVFTYDPMSFRFGLYITIGGIVAFLISLLLIQKMYNKK